MNDNKARKPLYIVALVIAALFVLQFFVKEIKIGSVTIKPFDLFSDVKAETLSEMNAGSYSADQVSTPSAGVENALPQAYGQNVPITGDVNQLKYFFNALKEAKNGKIRIAHFGDSIILGDIFSDALREDMQKKFGGNGIGFVQIQPEDSQLRQTVSQTFSGDWKTASVVKGNSQRLPLGIAGSVFAPSNSSWVKYDCTRFIPYLKSFKHARVFYTNAQSNSKLGYQFNGGSAQSVGLTPGGGVKETVLSSSGDATGIKLNMSGSGNMQYYGVSLENGNGVYLDNFAIRGNNGSGLSDIPAYVLKDFNSMLKYKLIILNFGVNVASPEFKDYHWYESKMEKVINYLKQNFPGVSILVVSIGDKGSKKGGSFVSEPAVQMVRQAQKNIAQKCGVAYWDMYEAMGGANSIAKWVDAKPYRLAISDYTHLTHEGGKVIGDLLFKALMNEYNKH
jgi:lysophospholipase L1-like esterase